MGLSGVIDYIKCAETNKTAAKNLLNSDKIQFIGNYDQATFEVLKGARGKYSDFDIMIADSGRIELKGSLHKIFNRGEHNHNDFSLKAAQQVISELSDEFGINPSNARIHKLEFGFNIRLPIPVKDLLRNVIAHNNLGLTRMKMKGPGYGKEVFLNEYTLKLYDKGQQGKLEYSLIRIEKHVNVMRCLKLPTLCLNDLTLEKTWQYLFNDFSDTFSDLIIVEPLIRKNLNIRERELYLDGSNPLYWEYLTPKQRCIKRKQLDCLLTEKGNFYYKEFLMSLMKEKFYELIAS